MDTIPDLRFNFPEGSSGGFPYVIKDYNGDGRVELAIIDPNLPYSEKQYGTFYFYNTKAIFDTIP